MSVLAYADTGQVLDVAAAEARAEQISGDLDLTADLFEGAIAQMREALEQRDDIALGYRSPGDYLSERFGGRLARLGVDLRRSVVRELTEAGLSTRAIAPVVGAGIGTVHRDREATRVPSGTPQTSPEDGEASTPTQPRPPVVGIDGKTYTRPAPVDHDARADAAVVEFPDLAFYRTDPEHCWRMGDKLREYRDRGELDMRLIILRRSVAVETAERDGMPIPPPPPELDALNAPYLAAQAAHAAAGTSLTCPTCGQPTSEDPS